ncbi:MAG: cysteine synthase CysM [Chitinophagales bacterium]
MIELVGNTPLVELKVLNQNPNVTIYGKLEGQNPGGSIKDRAALNMITKAIERGDLAGGKEIVEATSGNTGIALAMIAALKKIPITLLMPESSTEERKASMRAYGANLILTDGDKGIEYSRKLAEEMALDDKYVMLDQFGNQDNPDAHYISTGPEIWRDTHQKVTHFVSSMGTTGTIMGTSRFLKEQNPAIQIVGVQPEEGSQIPGIRKWSPEMVPSICDFSRVDDIRYVNAEQATEMTRQLAKVEGIMAGMSSGGAAAVALQLSQEIESGVIVCIICDRGDRYLSSGLFE